MDRASATEARNDPLVSIGLPVLNGERFLADALDSLLAQDFDDYELIISDNASTDETRAIAERYCAKDKRVRYVRHERQRGAAFNFNFVARAARGRYFKWAAHDDVSGPLFLRACVDVLEQDPGVVLCYPRAAEIDDDGEVTRDFPAFEYAHEDRPSHRVRSFLTERPACLETYGVMRRDVLLATGMIGGFDSADGVFLLEMMLRGRFRRVEQVAFFCRKHEGRSLVRYQSSRRQWYDDTASRGRGLPAWRLTVELLKAVLRSPVGAAEKTRSAVQVLAWAVRMTPALLRDLAAAVKSTVRLGGSAPGRGKSLQEPFLQEGRRR